MTPVRAVSIAAAAICLLSFATPTDAGRRRRRCRAACEESVSRCLTAGVRPRACRRAWIGRCMKAGPTACQIPFPTTTTTTTFPIFVFPTTTITAPPPPTVPTTSTIPTTSTTTTSTTTTTTRPPPEFLWTTLGPIQWATLPPPTAGRGMEFPVALSVDVGSARVEGAIRACPTTTSPENCTATQYVSFDPPTFSGAPGKFDFTARVTTAGYPCGGQDMYLVGDVTLVGDDGSRRGPVPTPLARFTLPIDLTSIISSSPTDLTLYVARDAPSPIAQLTATAYCGGGTVRATPDVDWLTVTPRTNPLGFEVTASTSLDPAGSPYHATIALDVDDPPGPRVVVPVTVHVAPLAMRWVAPPPAELAPVDHFPVALEITGPVDGIRVRPKALRPDDYYKWLETTLVTFDPAMRTAAPGVVRFDAIRPGDCNDEIDLALTADVWIVRNGAPDLGPFPFPSAPVHLTAGTLTLGLDVSLESGALQFRTVRGGSLEPLEVTLSVRCPGAPTESPWSASVDVPWLSLDRTSGRVFGGSGFFLPAFAVSALPADLDPSGGPYTGHVTVSVPGIVDQPRVLPVTLQIVDDVTVDWPERPPAVVDVGQEFDLSVAVTGGVSRVDGRVMPCDFAPPFCDYELGSFDIGLTNGGLFAGAPGEYPMHGRRWATCLQEVDGNYFGARFTVTRSDGTQDGPFFAARQYFKEPLTDTYSVLPAAIALRGIAGQYPLAATLSPIWLCGGFIEWTASTDVPWLLFSATTGRTGFRVRDQLTVVADTRLLDPAGSPYDGHVVLGAAGVAAPIAVVPVHVDLFKAD